MNPALLQHPYTIDYSLNSEDGKCLAPDRSYNDRAAISSNDYPLINQKPQNGLVTSGPFGQALAVPTHGLNYNANPAIHDSGYHGHQQLLLSPPSSVDGSTGLSLQHNSSPFGYTGTPKSVQNNVSSTDHYSTGTASFLPHSWNDPSITDYTARGRPTTLPLTLSPPMNSHSNSLHGHFPGHSHRTMDTYSNPYPYSRPFSGPEMPSNLFNKAGRSPSFHSPPMHSSYSGSCSYTNMAPQVPNRSEGPPFDETKFHQQLVTGRNQSLIPEISANIQKGFFQVDGKWTCYRRNYFTVICSFAFKSGVPDSPVYLQRRNQTEPVHQYAVSISAKTANVNSQESEGRTLVQHTPKRDKATESVPGRHTISPAHIQPLQPNGALNIGSMYAGGQHGLPGMLNNFDGYGSQSHQSAPVSHTFERIQFQKATANNGKRRAQQQYFHVVVELSVNTVRPGAEGNWVLVASKQSHPMVVRGRSPGHYKDNMRRDGQTHMDPDRDAGAGGDGGPAGISMPPLLGGPPSSMDWTATHSRQGHHYGSSFSRHGQSFDCSPTSTSSSNTFTSSPTTIYFPPVEPQVPASALSHKLNRSALRPAAAHEDSAPELGRRNYNIKRSYDEENAEYEPSYYSGESAAGELSPSFDFCTLPSVKTLCASS